jgi:DNA-binding NtrC family response regulator/pSer/pThr/pTyr-binding forkhead associated (FHA) protein
VPERHACRGATEHGAGRAFLFVCGPDACWIVELPERGELIAGRGADVSLKLDHDSVSRQHARLVVAGLTATASDLGSANGTLVNGEPTADPRVLAPGDIVELGVYKLVYSIERPAVGTRSMVPPDELQRRLVEEIERSDEFGRSFAIAIVRFDQAGSAEAAAGVLGAQLRPIDVPAWTGPHELAIVMPELTASQTSDRVARLASALRELDREVRVGWAVCPDDGCDEAALLGGARAAARAAAPGAQTPANEAVQRLPVGERTIVIAEPAMIQLYELVSRLAASDVPVLIRGETGTGKDLIAAALHHGSRRKARPFIALNCAALPDQLVESELFGHDKGAFTGATEARAGAFEAANGGTLFLDEIGELPAAAQAKLLRVVESQEVSRIGSHKARRIDVRIVAATNRDPSAEIGAGRFRQDLYFRLCGGKISVPPLRERRREIPVLAQTFLDDACRKLPREPLAIAGATMLDLVRHSWPGNVRELRQLMEYVAAVCPEPVLEPWHLRVGPGDDAPVESPPDSRPMPRFRPLSEEIADLERDRITVALVATGGVQARAAALIGMPLRTFITKLKRYNIKPR